MNITVVRPIKAHSAYRIAAENFATLAEKISENHVQIVTDTDCLDIADDLMVLIGNDSANAVTAELYLSQKIDALNIRYGADDYCIRSAEADGKHYLILAGGRPRSVLYAVYRYFELFCGCRWFWDGDRIPKRELPIQDINISESPRFEYRGLRYFAHRSLHRFQAEHWSFEEWKTEIDWVLKKRLNLLMLRIGMDDIFQKAFPDIVAYPDRDKPLPEAGKGYDDRTLFWSLEYRGELRKKILQYAFERDLMSPEDCGTISHWYSRTPLDFLEKVDPSLLPQSNSNYNDPTGRVWDIRDSENFDRYFKLTETHIEEYGKPEIFHTIGLGERRYSTDREANKRMKLYVYHKIVSKIREQYPNAPLLIASWDLCMQFTPDEVKELVAQLDPEQAIIFDYTSDTMRKNNFTQWGILNQFPWVFGIFSAYEPNSEIRGFYDRANERLKLAKSDPMCKGMIFWPELSHGDPFAIEYVVQNAWETETLSVSEQVSRYCKDRYPESLSKAMDDLWQKFMPIVQLTAWSVDGSGRMLDRDLFTCILNQAQFKKENVEHYRSKLDAYVPHQQAASEILIELSKLSSEDALTNRDLFDIARTVIGRYINAAILKLEWMYATTVPLNELEKTMALCESLMETLVKILGLHEDYSMLTSLERLRAVTETNPSFEHTLKNNAECSYCRSYIYENAAYLYLPEMRLIFDTVKKCVETDTEYNSKMTTEDAAKIRARYFNTPLADMEIDCGSFVENLHRAAKCVKKLNLLPNIGAFSR